MGFRKFEVFTEWARSAFDIHAPVAEYLQLAARHNLEFASLHLPTISDDPASVDEARAAVRFAAALGVGIVLYKVRSQPMFARHAPAILDAAEAQGVTVVIQNHCGSALESLADVERVRDEIADPRLKILLEVGHFHSAGVPWAAAWDALGERVALVHIKDQIGRRSVPFGTGEIDLPGLLQTLRAAGYAGDYVIEMEVEDQENTLAYLRDALHYVRAL